MSNEGTILNEIRRLRFEAGEMTQQQLAERVGVTRQTVIALEKEKFSPSLLLAFKISAVFNRRIDEVFHFQPDRPEKDKSKS